MAFKIETEHYCNGCIHFEADVQAPGAYYAEAFIPYYEADTIVRCANRHICAALVKRLMKESKNG